MNSLNFFECSCRKKFDTQHKLMAHQALSLPCKRRWEAYILSMAPTVPQRGGLKPNEDVIMEDHDQLQQIPTRTPTPDAASNDHGDMLGSEDEGSLSSQDDDEDSDDDDDEDGDSDVVAGDDDPAILIEGHRPASTNDAPRPGERSHELAEPLERPGDLYTEIFPHAGHVYRKESPRHQKEWEHLQTAGKGNLFYPFANDVDFDLGTWLHESGLSRSKIDEFLKLKYVSLITSVAAESDKRRSKIENLPIQVPICCEIGLRCFQTASHGGSSSV